MQADKGCWTCKQRKIGCDKSIPHCDNCVRTRRECAGYGIRLNWPDRLRSREKDLIVCPVVEIASAQEHPQTLGTRFLNTTHRHFRLATKRRVTWHQVMHRASVGPVASVTLYSPQLDEDGMLLVYYDQIIAPMCSTTRAANGFRCHILPMVLSSRDESTQALCSAILAIAAHHRQGADAASSHKIKAIHGLYKTLDNSSLSAETHVATTMMLCMYTVFDENEAQFQLHLNGAKHMLMNSTSYQRRQPVFQFLMGWIVYYDTLSEFAQPHRSTLNDFGQLEHSGKLQTMPGEVIGLFGCSVEVFDNISSINKIRTMILKSERSDIKRKTEQFRIVLQEKLESLVHFLSPDEVAHSTSAQIRDALATAELYRLASLLYLQRVVPVAGDEKKRISYLEQAYAAMKEVRVATSPWPVFIFACETRSEEQRIYILDILDRMDKIRNVGNVRVMRSVIENVWIQQDLRELVDATGTIPWWLCIESDLPVPWFA
ncbi:fungal-specific transcription factor domain-containing protein [Colletotrichum lupini]|nr:fungal-specific transcription factor domain-containing protein [Colletotrichum lupini]